MTTIALHKYLQKIEDLIEEHNIDEAVNHCRHILQQYPRHVDTYRTLAKAFLERGDYQDAIDLIQRVLSTNPSDFIAHVALSIAYKDQSQFDQSIWHLERALDVEPYNAPLREELVELYSLNKATVPESMAPTSAALARMYLKSEMYNAAISELRQSLKTEPDRIDLKVQLAETLWWANHRVEAVSVALGILDVLPNCIPVNALLAEIWLQTGRIAEAQTYLKRLQALTLLDEVNCDPETAVGRAFLTRGAPPLPEQMEIEYLGWETVLESESEPDTVAPIESDWIAEFTIAESEEPLFETIEDDPDIDDWLEEAALSTGENFGTAPLIMPSDPLEEETDWFVDPGVEEDESLDELLGDIGQDAQLDDWLTSLDSEDADAIDVAAETTEPSGLTGMLSGLLDSEFDAPAETVDAIDLADLFEEVTEPPAEDADQLTVLDGDVLDLEDVLAADSDDAWSDLAIEESSPGDDSFAEGLTTLFRDMDDATSATEESLPTDEDLGFAEFGEPDLDKLAESVPLTDEEPSGFTELFDELSVPAFPDETETPAAGWLTTKTDATGSDTADKDEDEPSGFTELFNELNTAAIPDEAETLDANWLTPTTDALDSDVSEEAETEDEHTGFTDIFDELSMEAFPEESQELDADWLTTAADDAPSELADGLTSEEMPDGLGAVKGGEFEPTENDHELSADWLIDQGEVDDAHEEDDEDDWLAELAGESETAVSDSTSDEPEIDSKIPTWLLGGDPTSEETGALDDLSTPDAQLKDTGLLKENPQMILAGQELPDWLDESKQEEPETAVPDPLQTDSMAELVHEELPDWLNSDTPEMDEPEHMPSDPLATDSMVELVNDELPSWLVDNEPEIIAKPIPEPDSELDLYKDDLNIPDWLMSDLSTGQDQAEVPVIGDKDEQEPISSPEPEEPSPSPSELDDDLGWLAELAGSDEDMLQDEDDSASYASRVAAGEGGAVEEPPTQVSMPDELPGALNWLEKDTDSEDAPLEEQEPLAMPQAETDIEDVLAGVTGELNADLDWLDSLAEESESPLSDLSDPIAEIDSGTSWLDDLAIASDTGPLEGLGDEPILPDFDDSLAVLPDEPAEGPGWLAELEDVSDFVGEPEADLVETAVVPLESDEDVSWLDELSAEPENDELDAPDFLDESFAAEDAVDLIAETFEEPHELLELAIDEADGAEEIQAGATVSEQEILPDAVPEDMEDAMAWLEGLAAGQGAPLEELPSISDELVTDPGELLGVDTAQLEPKDEALETDFSAILEPELASEKDIPEDIEDAMAWLEGLAAKQGARMEELPSMAAPDESELEPDLAEADGLDDSLEWLEELTEEPVTDMAVPLSLDLDEDELEPVDVSLDWLEEMSEEEAPIVTAVDSEEADVELAAEPVADVPENMDEAMVWLEALAAQQGAPAEELPSVSEKIAAAEPEPAAEVDLEPVRTEDPADLDDAMDWLEDLAAEQDTPLEDLPTIAGVVDEDLFAEPEPDIILDAESLPDDSSSELAEALDLLEKLAREDGTVLPEIAENDQTAVTTTAELSAALDWLEQLAQAEEKPDLETAVVDDFASMADEMPDDPDEALAWLQQVAAEQEQMNVESAGIEAAAETLIDLPPVIGEEPQDIIELEPETEDTVEPVVDIPPPPLPDDEPVEMAETEPEKTADVDLQIDTVQEAETDADFLAEMPDDPDAAMAWLEQLAARQGADLEELPSVTEEDMIRIGRESEPQAAVEEDLMDLLSAIESDVVDEDNWLDVLAQDADPLPDGLPGLLDDQAAAEDELAPIDESERGETNLPEADLAELEVPEDMDDAMAWLEALAAQQGADLEELPSLSGTGEMSSDVLDEVEQETAVPPNDMESTAAVYEPEAEEAPVELVPHVAEATAVAETDDDSEDEIDLSEGIDEALPDWLDEDTGSLEEMPGQTSWLRDLDEPDITGWLEEEETTISTNYDQSIHSRFDSTLDTTFESGPLPSTSDLLADTDAFSLPEEEIETTVFALDDEKLTVARQAVGDGELDEAFQSYQDLVEAGGGVMTLIGDLETLILDHPERPLFRHLLGDAYMRNGQLQKALDTYRMALDQI